MGVGTKTLCCSLALVALAGANSSAETIVVKGSNLMQTGWVLTQRQGVDKRDNGESKPAAAVGSRVPAPQ